MKNINQAIKEAYPQGAMEFLEPWAKEGFTIIANGIMADTSVSIGARLTYFLLMRRRFNKDYAFPGQKTLAREVGKTERMVRNYLSELEELGWIKVERTGRENRYWLKFLPHFS